MSDPREWIAASLLPGIGPARLARLRVEGVAPPDLFSNQSLAAALGLKPQVRDAIASYRTGGDLYQRASELAELAKARGWTLLNLDSPAYPDLLKQIHDPPILLWVDGDPDLLCLPQLAVVGSRHASADGINQASRFATDLAAGGLVINSGLARGIDTAAHRGALDAGGKTLAIIGTGLDRCYPAVNLKLAQQIRDGGGALVSEYPPGTRPLAQNFPRRNRIISGLSVGTLVVEAAPRSGSLITARQALEQGREVFALPGSIHNPLSRGCHALIREGATLVETSAHIIEELAPLLGSLLPQAVAEEATGEPSTDDPVLSAVPFAPISFDDLAQRLSLQPSQLQQQLMRLELEGYIELRGSLITRIG
ncbi:DNA-processing protein DprA [Marinobacterium lutimaris]|uniref:DNA protecting protein DprA n=1 Tax=Marinobacterium lutimaris TaxID=568106 RepID=A0A1H6DI96_9GAMM|nr:DNA-processing protein DprA [Marinobacterium lutimaris]SEG84395.1 DNA protecting protein DprA [Marinobacterium lutimaris]